MEPGTQPDRQPEPEPDRWDGSSLRRTASITALAAIVHAVLFLISVALMMTVPGQQATDAQIIDFYRSPDTRRVTLVGLYLMPFAGIAFLWFIVSMRFWIRSVVRSGRDELLSEVQLVSGVVFLALFMTSAAAMSATAAAVEFAESPIDPIEARILPGYGATLLIVLAMRIGAIFIFSSTTIARGSPLIPRWFVVVGYLVGLFLLLSLSLSPVLVIVFPIWVLVFGLLMLQRARRIPADVQVVTRTGPKAVLVGRLPADEP